jgi:hypothetical protein
MSLSVGDPWLESASVSRDHGGRRAAAKHASGRMALRHRRPELMELPRAHVLVIGPETNAATAWHGLTAAPPSLRNGTASVIDLCGEAVRSTPATWQLVRGRAYRFCLDREEVHGR